MYSRKLEEAILRAEKSSERFEQHLYELKGYVEAVNDMYSKKEQVDNG